MALDFPLRVRFEYEQDPETRLLYSHGVWGGINSQGEIEMGFYTESDRLPAYSECSINETGELSSEISPASDTRIVVRRIHSRILMNPQTARALVEWLQDRLSMMEDEELGATSSGCADPSGYTHQ